MSFFISDAMAEAASAGAAGAAPQGSLMGFALPLVVLAVFYFLLIRPQSKRAKEHKAMVDGLSKGDEVVTQGGVLGRIIEVGENFVLVDIAEGVQVKVQKQSIAALMPKGTIKSL